MSDSEMANFGDSVQTVNNEAAAAKYWRDMYTATSKMAQDYAANVVKDMTRLETEVNALHAEIDSLHKRLSASAEQEQEQEQEPVAWRTFDGEGQYDYRTYEENEDYQSWREARHPTHKNWVEPLYTAPPQQEKQDPVEYQMRMRPTWEVTSWSDWKKCSRDAAEDYLKTPKLHDWEYETRALYAQPVTQTVTQIPQQDSSNRKWFGLTDEDMQECVKTADYNQGQYKRTPYWAHLATAIEAKLKEKNT
jgi:hypothetical protein